VSANPSHAADEASEALLLERLRAGDEAAYALLVRDFGGRMLAATRRILGNEEDAQDAVQEAFLSAFKALERFHGEAQVSTWLHRIAINAALMKLRSQRRREERDIDELLPRFTENGHHLRAPQSWSEPADDPLVRAETRAVVRRSIDQLPDNYRNALLLRDIEGLDNEELAAQLGITVNAAKIRVHRARQALRTLLDPHFASVQE
jgi:RNA polymerase sigma-70 factor (ECF subfamily)